MIIRRGRHAKGADCGQRVRQRRQRPPWSRRVSPVLISKRSVMPPVPEASSW